MDCGYFVGSNFGVAALSLGHKDETVGKADPLEIALVVYQVHSSL